VKQLVRTLTAEPTQGRTALYDSVYLAAQKMKQAANPRKVLLVITDADDNHSRYRPRELEAFMREAGVVVYVLALPCDCNPEWGPSAEPVLWAIAEDTGGRYMKIAGEEDLPEALRNMNFRESYLVGFRPSGLEADGKYHQVKLHVSAPDEHNRLHVYWRRGYFAPAN
jgi:VWFA-related protein